jgi:hypothetical protein
MFRGLAYPALLCSLSKAAFYAVSNNREDISDPQWLCVEATLAGLNYDPGNICRAPYLPT